MLEESARRMTESGSFSPGWHDGMLTVGLVEAGRYDAVMRYIDAWLAAGGAADRIDQGLEGYSLLNLPGYDRRPEYRDLAGRICSMLCAWPRDEEGTVLYSDTDTRGLVYSDGTGMGTVFTARYAKVTDDPALRDLSLLQIKNWAKNGVDGATGLPYHGYSVREGARFPNLGWGRGTGWLMLAVGSVAESLPDPETDALCARIAEPLFGFLGEDGMFPWTLAERRGSPDTSATGMIMWGALRMRERGLLPSLTDDTVDRAARATASFAREDGRVFGASGECYDFGCYSEKYDEHNKWGQGAALAFLSLWGKLK